MSIRDNHCHLYGGNALHLHWWCFFSNGFEKAGLLSKRNKQSSSEDERPCTLVITQNVQSASSFQKISVVAGMWEWMEKRYFCHFPFCPKSSCWASQSSLLLLSLVMVYGGGRYWSQAHQSVWLTVCFIMMRSLNSIQVQLAEAPQSDVRVQLRQLGLSWDSATYWRGETRSQSTWHSISTTPKTPSLTPTCPHLQLQLILSDVA